MKLILNRNAFVGICVESPQKCSASASCRRKIWDFEVDFGSGAASAVGIFASEWQTLDVRAEITPSQTCCSPVISLKIDETDPKPKCVRRNLRGKSAKVSCGCLLSKKNLGFSGRLRLWSGFSGHSQI